MKIILILLSLFTVTSYAADYTCKFRNYTLDLDMTNDRSTGLFIIERYRYETLYVGYVGHIERKANTSDFYFYGNNGENILSFKNSDLKNEPSRMSGRYEGTLEGFYLVDKFNCTKR
tara:strand:- start:230388 stop:230738 length:351 start_codon:yes stop_codon:yes gene_type:complete